MWDKLYNYTKPSSTLNLHVLLLMPIIFLLEKKTYHNQFSDLQYFKKGNFASSFSLPSFSVISAVYAPV